MADNPPSQGNPNWGSNTVNGQLVPQAPSSAFWPRFFGSQVRGPGYWPRQGSWQVPPVIPNAVQRSQMSPNTGSNANISTQSGSPFHPTKSTVIFAFVAFALGMFMLNYIHYGKGS